MTINQLQGVLSPVRKPETSILTHSKDWIVVVIRRIWHFCRTGTFYTNDKATALLKTFTSKKEYTATNFVQEKVSTVKAEKNDLKDKIIKGKDGVAKDLDKLRTKLAPSETESSDNDVKEELSLLEESRLLDLPDEILLNVFRNLGPDELDNSFKACRTFQRLVRDDSLLDLSRLFPHSVLLREDWEKHSNDLGIALEKDDRKLTPNEKRRLISEFMKVDPYSRYGEKKWQTHHLLELPKGLTLRPLIYDAEGKQQPWIRYIEPAIVAQHGDKALAKTEFVFICNTVFIDTWYIAKTRGKLFKSQKEIVEEQVGYEIPDVLTAVALNVLKKLKSGEHLYEDKPRAYTHCIEVVKINGIKYRVGVAGLSSHLGVYKSLYFYDCAAAVLRIF